MLGKHLTIPIFIPGTLAGNHTATFTSPLNLKLVHVSAVQSSAAGSGAGTIKVGRAGDDDAYLTATTLGVSGTPVEKTEFAGDEVLGTFPVIPAGTVGLVTITNGATARANVFALLTFLEG
jgi:hypothetical protein